MTDFRSDRAFLGSVPRAYETYMVPMFFAPYAADLAARVRARNPARVLEVACGTGVATRAMASALGPGASIVATDLNQPMLDQAAATVPAGLVEWRPADAQSLPFPDACFDAVVCQFGVMFFPDKPRAFAEARRVLRTGGTFFFNSWDRLEDNVFAHAVTEGVATVFPEDPPRFLARTPHGYHEPARIRGHLAEAGFRAPPRIETVALRSRAESARNVAIAFCRGSPLREEIEARDLSKLEEAVAASERSVALRFGSGEVEGKMQAHVLEIARA